MSGYEYVRPVDLSVSTEVIVPHFAIPFQFRTGPKGAVVSVHEQDTFEEIRDCVASIVRYTRGQRPEAPDFGITPPEFAMGVDMTTLIQEIEENEPRMQLLTSSSLDSKDESIERVVLGIIENESSVQVNTGGG